MICKNCGTEAHEFDLHFMHSDKKCITKLKQELEELRMKCEKYREALESISKNTCCEPCQEAKKVAINALERSEG